MAKSGRGRARAHIIKVTQVGAVVVAGAGAVALTLAPIKAPPAYVSPASARTTAEPTATLPTATPPTATPSTTTSASPHPVALVIGDAFAAIPRPDSSFVCLAVAAEGWSCLNEAGSGSGYVAAGAAGSFSQQVDKAASTTGVGLVVVTGGAVDASASTTQLRVATTALVTNVKGRFPRAKVVILAPFPVAGADSASLVAASTTLDGLADGTTVRYVNTSQWFVGITDLVAPDGASLTPEATVAAQNALRRITPQP